MADLSLAEKVEGLTGPDIEAVIDRAGRDRVFALARRYGWSAEVAPPAWVWRAICAEVEDALLRAKGEQNG